jgi:hypothetical protein
MTRQKREAARVMETRIEAIFSYLEDNLGILRKVSVTIMPKMFSRDSRSQLVTFGQPFKSTRTWFHID